MTDPAQVALEERAALLRELHEARVRAELVAADRLAPGSDAVESRGSLLAQVLVVKGLPGPAEAAGGQAVSGTDGEAMSRALEALGHDPAQTFFTLARSVAGADPSTCARRLHALIEAVDPQVVIALDDVAASDLSTAMGAKALVPGVAQRIAGRKFVSVGGFEDSLSDEGAKRLVWRQLHAAAPDGPIY